MALTAANRSLRRSILDLSRDSAKDLAALWASIETPNQAREALNDILPALVDTYGLAASSVAAEWYDGLRDTKDVRGQFRAIPAELPKDTGTGALVGWAESTATDMASFTTLIAGGLQRRIANQSRFTVMQSSIADPGARGWARTGIGECDFCQMLIDRGSVYTEATADFDAHDHCQCGAEPDF